MGLLTPTDLEKHLAAGCSSCGSRKLAFRMYVDARLPIMGGEPIGRLGWAYDGEAFCDGVYEITCGACSQCLFSADVCPRCHAPGGLAIALESENAHPLPLACPGCGHEEVAYLAMVPAETTWEGKKAEKARTEVDLHDPGFHGYQAVCKHCGPFAVETSRCPLCEAPAPLRDRA
jgi:hypothetical protein